MGRRRVGAFRHRTQDAPCAHNMHLHWWPLLPDVPALIQLFMHVHLFMCEPARFHTNDLNAPCGIHLCT